VGSLLVIQQISRKIPYKIEPHTFAGAAREAAVGGANVKMSKLEKIYMRSCAQAASSADQKR
jgi:hypothetical protein